MPAEASLNPFRFAASYRDQESPSKYQYYMGARYHDPAYGRFTQVDPVGGGSVFGYAINNPLTFGDPGGTDPLKWIKRIIRGFVGSDPGYVDINVSLPIIFGVLGPTFGVQIGQEGLRGYGGPALMTSRGFAVTGSANTPSSGWQVGLQYGRPNFTGGQFGASCCFRSPFVEAGMVSPGISLSAYYVSRPFGCFWCR